MNDSDDSLEPMPEFESAEFKRLSEIQQKASRFTDAVRGVKELTWDQICDIKSALFQAAIDQADEKRAQISEAKADDVADRRTRVLTTAADIESIRPGLSTRSLSELVHKRIAADKTLLPTQIPSVETIRKILSEHRRSS